MGMKHVTLYIDAKRTMEIGNELRTMGWKQGVDFDYAYYKAYYDNFSHEAVTPKRAIFVFYTDSNASYFMLRWG